MIYKPAPIILERAMTWANYRKEPSYKLTEAVIKRLFVKNPLPIMCSNQDEFPEDVVIALLQDDTTSDNICESVCNGWDVALSLVEQLFIDNSLTQNYRDSLIYPFTRIFRVAELTGHEKLLTGVIKSLEYLLKPNILITKRQVQQVLEAGSVYPNYIDCEKYYKVINGVK